VQTNISPTITQEENLAQFFSLLGQPVRIRILLTLGSEEACVCHLEAALGLRQAKISQHLMALRDLGLVDARRDGRNIFYRLADPALIEIILRAGALTGIPEADLRELSRRPVPGCPCPRCNNGETSGCSSMGLK